jgi:hypothetical protein
MKTAAKRVLRQIGFEIHKALPPNILKLHFDVARSSIDAAAVVRKAGGSDTLGRFREIVMDPLNLLIQRVPNSGMIDGEAVILHNGLRAGILGNHAYYGPFSVILVINRGVHEPLQEFVFQELLSRLPADPIMIELGAYWAHYSMWMKHAKPCSQVFMLEPNAEYLNVGRRNFTMNSLAGHFIEAFVGRDHWCVDRFLREATFARLNVLLADIEGYESEMLEGAQRAIANTAVDYFLISTHSETLHRTVIDQLRQGNYRIEVDSNFAQHTTSCDGFVFASSPNATQIFSSFHPLGRTELMRYNPDALIAYLNEVSVHYNHGGRCK